MRDPNRVSTAMDHFGEYPDEPHRGGAERKRDSGIRADEPERFAHDAEKSSRTTDGFGRGVFGGDESLGALRAPLDIPGCYALFLRLISEKSDECVYLLLRQTRRTRVAQESGADGRTQITRRLLSVCAARQQKSDGEQADKQNVPYIRDGYCHRFNY